MQPFVGKLELLERIEHARRQFLDGIGSLSADQLESPGVVGLWSIRDIVAHFIAHEQFALEELRQALRGEDNLAQAQNLAWFNERAVNRWRTQTAASTFQAWELSCRQIQSELSQLSEAEYDPSGDLVQRLGDSVDGAFANNTYEHYLEHLPTVLDWIQTKPAP